MEYLAHLDRVTGAFLAEIETADPAGRCASIRWTTTQLGAHLGGIHRWAVGSARDGKRHSRANVPDLDVPVAAWYAESRDILIDAFATLDPAATTFTLSSADRTVGFWHRRQLFESLVHLWDLRSAASEDTPPPPEVPAAVNADGISELFEVFVPRATSLEPLDGVVTLQATDTGQRWTFRRDWHRDDSAEPTATVRGSAGELLLYAWNRAERVERSGDLDLLARFERAHIRP